ncbi:MAG TPA: alpha/beta hydrolase [Burkholderiales bacterium]|nr:alpha/beta hydrolase [Burkholderiales bacterium]
MRAHELRCLGPRGFHRTAYYEWGDAANPRVVVCVHGLTRNGRDFDDLAQALAPRFRVLCPDVAGRGSSEWLSHKPDYGYPLYLSDMAALIARTGAERVDWVGTSMGGLIGMMLTGLPGNPIRRLLLNDVGPFIPKAALERLAAYVGKAPRFATLDALGLYLRTVMAPFGRLTDQQWRHLTEHSSRRYDDGTFGVCYDPAIGDAFAGELRDVVLWPVWDAISCPTLVLRGKESDLLLRATAEEMTRRGPKARLVEFDHVGHAPALMAEDQIAVVREFLEGP